MGGDKHATLDLSRPDDKLVYKQVSHQAFLVLRDWEPKFSDFIYASKAQPLADLLRRDHPDAYVYLWGGLDGLERVRIGICPYGTLEHGDFPVSAVQIDFDKFAGQVTHRDLLGSVLGLGIERGKIGDILLFDGYAVVFADQAMADYIATNLTKIGRNKITTSTPDMDMLFVPLDDYRTVTLSLDNPRISALSAKAFNQGRDKMGDLLKAKKITLNWAVVTKDNTTLQTGDTLSVRGYGKLVVQSLTGNSYTLHVYK